MESLHAIPEREGERRPVGGDGEAYVAAQSEGRIRLAADPSDWQPGESDDGTHRWRPQVAGSRRTDAHDIPPLVARRRAERPSDVSKIEAQPGADRVSAAHRDLADIALGYGSRS